MKLNQCIVILTLAWIAACTNKLTIGSLGLSSATSVALPTPIPANVHLIYPSANSTFVYTTIEGIPCGDIVLIEPGTWNVANGNIARIHISGKNCTADKPLLVEAADPNNQPIFDYTATPLDGNNGKLVPGSYNGGDYSRGAWQVINSSYVTIEGIVIKGATSNAYTSVSGIRYVATDHLTIRSSTFQQNWEGVFGTGTNTLLEYNNFLGNGNPSEDQEHQFYDGGGDNLTVRYNYLNDDNCCINQNGTITPHGGGQNLHLRSWHAYIYGNWMQDAADYEWDMDTPDPTYAPNGVTTDMYQYFYNNVVVTNPTPENGSKVMTFFGDGAGFANGSWCGPICTMHFDGQWNTFYVRYPYSTYPQNIPPNYPGGEYALFQISNNPSILGPVSIHLANNVLHFVTEKNLGKQSLFVLNSGGTNFGKYTITGNNNWFDSNTINTCATLLTASGGTCLLNQSTFGSQAAPPFMNLGSLDLHPSSAGAFGFADTTQTLKSPREEYAPFTFATLSTYINCGAIQ